MPPSGHKRHRDEEIRHGSSVQKREKYTAIACNQCRKRKIKCSGSNPCHHCKSSAVDCTYPENCDSSQLPKTNTKERMAAVEEQLTTLMEHMKQLANNVQDIRDTQTTQGHEGNTAHYSLPSVVGNTHRRDRPTEPQFIGPTSSDYNFSMAKNTLRQMGIQSEDLNNQAMSLTSPFPSRAQSPESARIQCGLSMNRQDIQHAFEVYREELHPVYPFLDLDEIRKQMASLFGRPEKDLDEISDQHKKTLGILKMILASVSVLKARGKTAFAQRLVDTVEDEISTILRQSEVSLPDLEILTLTSIYYFHCDEPVLAWRRIGNAARAAIEMGLHRRETLEKNFLDVSIQAQALKIFWCIYVLDRRWSFGIGMPFVLHDEDIDPALPTRHCEPYLRCMISYGQICSKVWKAVAGFTDINATNKDTVNYLDFQIQQWHETIPSSLHLIHPRLGDAAQNQPKVLQMLRTFLYIRANHMRIYVHRHNILSPSSIAQNPSAARLVIDIAKDTIHVLVHLRETSTVYDTQQVPFNYFLVSAFSAIFLGVCHAPERFSHTCRTEFYSALELLYTLSARSSITRRLWKGIKGLRHIAPRLGLSPTKSPEDGALPSALDNSIYDTIHQVARTSSPSFPPYRQRRATIPSYISNVQHIADALGPIKGISRPVLTPQSISGEFPQTTSTQYLPITNSTTTETASTLEDPMSLSTVSDVYEMGNDLTAFFEAFFSQNQQLATDDQGAGHMDSSGLVGAGLDLLQDREELSQLFETFL